MRAIALVFLLSSGTMALAQQSAPGVPNRDKLFQLPSSQGLNQPQFKLDIPNGIHGPFALPGTIRIEPRASTLDPNVDKGIVVHPPQGSFADRQPRKAQSSKLYPDLKILPTEMAQLNSRR